MKYKVFDVVELQNGDRATILSNCNDKKYKAEIVNVYGISQGVIEINEKEIKNSIVLKKSL